VGKYENGSKGNPVRCYSWGDACDVAVERNQPVWCLVLEDDGATDSLGIVYPTRCYRPVWTGPRGQVQP